MPRLSPSGLLSLAPLPLEQHCPIMQTTYVILHFLVAMSKMQKTHLSNKLLTQYIQNIISTWISSQGVLYFLFKSQKFIVFFTLTVQPNSDQPCFKYSIITCRWWLQYWTARPQIVVMSREQESPVHSTSVAPPNCVSFLFSRFHAQHGA